MCSISKSESFQLLSLCVNTLQQSELRLLYSYQEWKFEILKKNLYTKVRNPKVNKVILINLIFKICFNGYFHTCTFLHIFSVVQLYIECALY